LPAGGLAPAGGHHGIHGDVCRPPKTWARRAPIAT
jgi:hypothetical protein